MQLPPDWLALMVGNSRWHWGHFQDKELVSAWDSSSSLSSPPGDLSQKLCSYPLVAASVVPAQLKLFKDIHPVILKTKDVPLSNTYPTLGIDRALATFGTGSRYGFPCLVIDAGTALTLTGADSAGRFYGGAILPGLSLQLTALGDKTGALPSLSLSEIKLPPKRWAQDTATAIGSGVIYGCIGGIVDFIQDWQIKFPDTTILLTGGDALALFPLLAARFPEREILHDPHIVLRGIAACSGRYLEKTTQGSFSEKA